MEANLDESFLFSNFQDQPAGKSSKPKKGKKRKLVDIINGDCGELVNISEEITTILEQKDKYIQQLEDQNNKLKAVIKRICGPQDLQDDGVLWQSGSFESMPIAAVLFLNNDFSLSYRKEIENSLTKLAQTELKQDDIYEKQNLKIQPSAVPLRAFAADTKGKRAHKSKSTDETNEPHVFSSVQYYIDFCLDRTGLPLLDNNPAISQLWSIPVYEQVFLNALPLVSDGQKIFIRQKKTACCFNCLGDHNVSQCDQPKDYLRISSNREEFINKFGSPGRDSRYHQNESDRFKDFKPGQVSNALREALGINENELPPYIYKMRTLGYPPGYLKSNEPTLLMYDKEGKMIEEHGMEEGELESPSCLKDILYEGFNAPLSEGTIDRSHEYGMLSFEESYSLESSGFASFQSPSASAQNNHERYDSSRSRVTDQTGWENEDMDLDDSVIFVHHPPPIIDLTKDDDQYPASANGRMNRDDSFKDPPPPLPHSTPEHPPPPPAENQDRLALTSIEIGELLEKAEKLSKTSKIVDTYLAQGQAESYMDHQSGSSHRQWWLEEPISSTAGILYFTYTPPPTIKADVKIENAINNTIMELDREPWKTDSTSWYDPLYGDLATNTGIYDSIKEILKKRKRRKQIKKVR